MFELVLDPNVPGLYVANDPQATISNARFVYVALGQSGGRPSIGLKQAWSPSEAIRGVYCFFPRIPANTQFLQKFVAAVRNPEIHRPTFQYLLWLDDPEEWVASQAAGGAGANAGAGQYNQIEVRLFSGAFSAYQIQQPFAFHNSSLKLETFFQVAANEAENGLALLPPAKSAQVGALIPPAAAAGNANDSFTVNIKSVDLLLTSAFAQGESTYDQQGVMQFDVQLNERDLDGLDVGLRYFWRGDRTDPQRVQSARYPVFDLASNSGAPQSLALSAYLDPWYAYQDARGADQRTYFAFQQPADAAAVGSYFRDTGGRPISLRPQPPQNLGDANGARLLFMPKPAALASANGPGVDLYAPVFLAPVGDFSIACDKPVTPWMCGLTGMEYLLTGPDDTLSFVKHQPAFAPQFGVGVNGSASDRAAPQPQPPSGGVLNSTVRTSWLQIKTNAANSAAPRGYLSQPTSSVHFADLPQTPGGAAAAPKKYPLAVGAFVWPQNKPLPPTPMAPYAGIYAQSSAHSAPAELYQAYESQVLTAARHQRFRPGAPDGPVFVNPYGSPPYAPLPGGFATTPQGMLLRLSTDPAGVWKQMILARSPSGLQQLAFNPPPERQTIAPQLSNVLMRDQLFLVIAKFTGEDDVDWLGFDENQLSVGGFVFKLNPGDQFSTGGQFKSERPTFLIFKFATTQSLQDLIQSTDQWAETGAFVGGPTLVESAQIKLQQWIEAARPHGANDPFVYFRDTILTDPAWTGVLGVNCAIDGDAMPPSLQMLFAGIDGELKAHHFGVEVNQVKPAENHSLAIEKSSLFGVINYDNAAHTEPEIRTAIALQLADRNEKQPYDFEVIDLTVAIQNSAVTDFHAQIGMTMYQLFGREVLLQEASDSRRRGLRTTETNTVIISGKYEQHGDSGTVTFVSDQKHVFAYPAEDGRVRVLRQLTLADASLAPVAADAGDKQSIGNQDGKLILSRFSMGGELLFRQAPFPDSPDLDLFSFGVDEQNDSIGLPFSGLALDISFKMKQGRKDPNYGTHIAFDPSGVLVSDNKKAIRPQGLLNSFPLKLVEFKAAGAAQPGLDAKSLGAQAVQATQLENYTTSAPAYALRLELPLGSLGSLSDVHAGLTAYLVLGWGPSATIPDDDGGLLLMQLPELSAGFKGFNLQGILSTVFGDANLLSVPLDAPLSGSVYAILFNNVALSVFGIKLPPRVIVNFTLFSQPGESAQSNVAWYLAAAQQKSAANLTVKECS